MGLKTHSLCPLPGDVLRRPARLSHRRPPHPPALPDCRRQATVPPNAVTCHHARNYMRILHNYVKEHPHLGQELHRQIHIFMIIPIIPISQCLYLSVCRMHTYVYIFWFINLSICACIYSLACLPERVLVIKIEMRQGRDRGRERLPSLCQKSTLCFSLTACRQFHSMRTKVVSAGSCTEYLLAARGNKQEKRLYSRKTCENKDPQFHYSLEVWNNRPMIARTQAKHCTEVVDYSWGGRCQSTRHVRICTQTHVCMYVCMYGQPIASNLIADSIPEISLAQQPCLCRCMHIRNSQSFQQGLHISLVVLWVLDML